MTTRFKIIVAGAGPGGCVFARDLAAAGHEVVVYEKGDYETLGHNWSDAVERIALKEIGLDVPEEGPVNKGPLVKKVGRSGKGPAIFEEHAFPEMDVWAPDYSSKKKIHFRYITTDRRALGKLLADQATEAGARVEYGYEVVKPILEGGKTLDEVRVTGAIVKELASGEETTVQADVTADDTGFAAALRTQLPGETGISEKFKESEFAMVHRTVRQRDKTKAIEDIVRDHYRYGFYTGYQWAQELNEDEIDVGAGIKYKAKVPDPQETVERFIAKHDSITDKVVRGGGGLCLVGKSPYSLVANGLVVLGDAASQTIPMTGCGAGGAMMGGKLAAESVDQAAEIGQADISALWSYNRKWFVDSGRGANYAALTALRNILQKLSNFDNSFLFRKDVFSGDMLTSSINGIFQVPTLSLMMKTGLSCISRPDLLLTLNKATSIGTKLYKHYLRYPKSWNPRTFESWSRKSEQLFLKAQ